MAMEEAQSSVTGGTQGASAEAKADASEGPEEEEEEEGTGTSIHFNESLPMTGTSMPTSIDLLPIFWYE